MDAVDVFSIVASVVSVILSIVAIVLSVLFYRMGEQSSKDIAEKAKSIDIQTNILKTLIDSLLNTSFQIIRDNNQAMQKYMLSTIGDTKSKTTEDKDDKEDSSLTEPLQSIEKSEKLGES